MSKSPKNTNAFSYKDATKIENAIEKMARRIARTISKPTLTHREMLNLIAPSDHIEFLLKARQIEDIGRYVANSTDDIMIGKHEGKQMAITFQVHGEDSPVMPRAPQFQYYEANRDLTMALKACAHEHAANAIAWGHVKAVFKYLNQKCRTPQQVRYFWPSILGIMSLDENLDNIRANIAPHRQPLALPVLPLKVRQMIRETAATVTMALMLPALEDDPVAVPDVEVTYKVDSGGMVLDHELGWWSYPVNT